MRIDFYTKYYGYHCITFIKTHTHTHTHTHIQQSKMRFLFTNSVCLFFFFFKGHTSNEWKFPS